MIDVQRTLIAFDQVPVSTTKTELWLYKSTNGGRKWTYTTKFGACIVAGCS